MEEYEKIYLDLMLQCAKKFIWHSKMRLISGRETHDKERVRLDKLTAYLRGRYIQLIWRKNQCISKN